jgi:hypothetical protein
MNDNFSIGWLKDWSPKESTLGHLSAYLDELKAKFFRNDANYTEEVWQNFNLTLGRHFSRLGTFLDEPNLLLQNLVLGNVQSGKTGHLMANIAWANDNAFDLVILLNGNKTTLSKQTARRVSKELGSTVEMHHVQTEANRDFESFVHKLGASIANRKVRKDSSLPVAVLIKNSSRIDGLREGLLALQDVRNSPLRVLVLDDEADQASPDNSTSSPKKENTYKAVHSALVRLAESIHGKTIYLSYTATPQAILHQDRDALHQPQFCSVVPSGPSYFGISELLNTPNSLGVFEDLLARESGETEADRRDSLLEKLLVEFLISSWIHARFNDIFHGGDRTCLGKSVQMLIHPSGNQQEHRDFASSFEALREDLIRVLDDPEARNFFIENTLGPVFETVTKRSGLERMTREIAQDCLDYVFDLIKDATEFRICVINSDERYRLASTGQDSEFLPADEAEWDEAAAWILVGGDILGRGLTIPHLVSTLFIRNPRSPNFDTAVQQMRFCGYRMNYRNLIRVVAPKEILQDYANSVEVDTALRTAANLWDLENRDLRNNPPAVIHITPSGSRLRATRNSVISQDVKKVFSGSGRSTLNWIGNLGQSEFKKSLATFDNLLIDFGIELDRRSATGILLFDINPDLLPVVVDAIWPEQSNGFTSQLLQEIVGHPEYLSRVFGEKAKLALDLPVEYRNYSDFGSHLGKLINTPIKRRSPIGFRTLASMASDLTSDLWLDDRGPQSISVQTLVGDSERSIRDLTPNEATLLIKPFALTNDGHETEAFTLAAMLWLPADAPQIFLHTGESSKNG